MFTLYSSEVIVDCMINVTRQETGMLYKGRRIILLKLPKELNRQIRQFHRESHHHQNPTVKTVLKHFQWKKKNPSEINDDLILAAEEGKYPQRLSPTKTIPYTCRG